MVLFDFDLLEEAEITGAGCSPAAFASGLSVAKFKEASFLHATDIAVGFSGTLGGLVLGETVGGSDGTIGGVEAGVAADVSKGDLGTVSAVVNGGLDDACGATTQETLPAVCLDEERWHAITEPSADVLMRWTRSEPVREILRMFVLEDAFGEADAIRFTEIYRLLEVLGLTHAAFVAKFVDQVPTSDNDVDALADRILARFASPHCSRSCLCFRDFFRMLEALGVNRYRLLSNFVEDASALSALMEAQVSFNPLWRFGHFLVERDIGSGFRGPCCYLAEHVSTRQRHALKWPVPHSELATWQEINKKAGTQPGLPRVVACGYFEGEGYVVTDLLGSSLSKIFGRLQDHTLEKRWAALRVIGRLVLRRLMAMHRAGFVHNDVSPENILLGRARLTPSAASKQTLYVVDFGLARRSGSILQRCEGSAEWSSTRSADGGARFPHDDLEALGWVLVYGLFGELPWCGLLADAYERWHEAAARGEAVRAVQESKLQLLQGGWDSHVGHWRKLADVPAELVEYLCLAAPLNAATAPEEALPDYPALLSLLGQIDGACGDCLDAEGRDLQDFHSIVEPLL